MSAIGLIDELSTNNYLLIETIDGRAFYVPLYRQARGIAVGDSIALMRLRTGGSKAGETPTPLEASSASVTSMSLLDIRFTKLPDEKVRTEAIRIGKKRAGFGLHLF